MEVGNASCLLALGMLGQDATQPVPDVLPSLIAEQAAHRARSVRVPISQIYISGQHKHPK